MEENQFSSSKVVHNVFSFFFFRRVGGWVSTIQPKWIVFNFFGNFPLTVTIMPLSIIENWSLCRLLSQLCPPCTTCTGSWKWSIGMLSPPTSLPTKKAQSSSAISAFQHTSLTQLLKRVMQVQYGEVSTILMEAQILPQEPAGTWLLNGSIPREVLLPLIRSRLMFGALGSLWWRSFATCIPNIQLNYVTTSMIYTFSVLKVSSNCWYLFEFRWPKDRSPTKPGTLPLSSWGLW